MARRRRVGRRVFIFCSAGAPWQGFSPSVGPSGWSRLPRAMFFRRKKAPPAPALATASEPATGAGASDGGAVQSPLAGPSTQFLTGEAGRDRRTVQVLLEAIARVSEARNLESLLVDTVDSSIEMTGAERGLLILRGGQEGELVVRVGRLRGKKPLSGELRYSTSVAGRV